MFLSGYFAGTQVVHPCSNPTKNFVFTKGDDAITIINTYYQTLPLWQDYHSAILMFQPFYNAPTNDMAGLPI